jgi:hypothetical protein
VAYSITTFATIVTLFGFPLLKEAVGMWLCFGIFSFITFLGLLLLYFMAIETKNKTDNEIDEIFLSRENNQEQLKLNQASDNSSFS